MFLRGLVTAIASVGLMATPAFAASTSASKLSVANSVRVGAPASAHSNKLEGTALIGILVFVGIVGAVYAVAQSSDQKPNSP